MPLSIKNYLTAKLSQMFCNILVHTYLQYVYHVTEEVQALEVGSIVVVGVLKCFVLVYSVYGLKAVQMNKQRNRIQELKLYEFELDHNVAETSKKKML